MEVRNWYWEWSGRNGGWFVDKYDSDEDSRGTYGRSIEVGTRRAAVAVASILNEAFNAGRTYEREQNNG